MGFRTTRETDPLARKVKRLRRTGVSLMVSSLAAGAVLTAVAPGAVAQEAPEKPENLEALELEKTAYYTYPANGALPPTFTSEFPPGVVCLVIPGINDQLGCPEALKPVGDAVTGGLGVAADNEPNPPADPVPPNSLPVGLQNGSKRYESAVKFATPDLGDQVVDRFVVVMSHTNPTYDSSSPAFRQAVLAVLTCARENDEGGRCQQDQFNKLDPRVTEPAEYDGFMGVEACPLTEPFEEGDSQAPPKNEDGQYEQPVDCLYGTNGVPLGDGSWLFDLTFAVQGWADGQIPNEGILFRPARPENLAYGDPDVTKSSQVTFTKSVEKAAETSPAPEAPAPFDSGSGTDTSSSGGFSTGSSGSSGGGFTSSPSGGVSGDVFAPPVSASPDQPAPEVADGGAAPIATDTPTVPVAGVTDEAPGSAWWMWLLAPIFAGGAFVTAQSLTAPVAIGAAERSGAMTRLIAQNHTGQTTSSSMAQV